MIKKIISEMSSARLIKAYREVYPTGDPKDLPDFPLEFEENVVKTVRGILHRRNEAYVLEMIRIYFASGIVIGMQVKNEEKSQRQR